MSDHKVRKRPPRPKLEHVELRDIPDNMSIDPVTNQAMRTSEEIIPYGKESRKGSLYDLRTSFGSDSPSSDLDESNYSTEMRPLLEENQPKSLEPVDLNRMIHRTVSVDA